MLKGCLIQKVLSLTTICLYKFGIDLKGKKGHNFETKSKSVNINFIKPIRCPKLGVPFCI